MAQSDFSFLFFSLRLSLFSVPIELRTSMQFDDIGADTRAWDKGVFGFLFSGLSLCSVVHGVTGTMIPRELSGEAV